LEGGTGFATDALLTDFSGIFFSLDSSRVGGHIGRALFASWNWQKIRIAKYLASWPQNHFPGLQPFEFMTWGPELGVSTCSLFTSIA